ncbi:hypothetical protein OOZ53_00220 [Hoeflea sp. E7-10]|uniref:Uncharacterized protein n=2 Tax=Hoeflea poritis TaxID=2993659 RepID=A0ABT4VGB9_9HYPH|nr:hypothetical protein [Hoeflea poritis]
MAPGKNCQAGDLSAKLSPAINQDRTYSIQMPSNGHDDGLKGFHQRAF